MHPLGAPEAARAEQAGRGACGRRGLTFAELVMTVAMTSVLVSLVLVAIGRARQINTSASCAANLRAIGVAMVAYAHDNGGYLPYNSDGGQWEHMLLRYIERKTFRCGSDQELFPALGSSYDWRNLGPPDSTHPNSLAGRQLSTVRRLDAAMAYEALPGWHRPGSILVVQVDGSVQSLDQQKFVENLAQPVGQ